jgi:hypothetical protein
VRNRTRPSESGDPWAAPDPALALALQQLRWYARHRDRDRRVYWAVETLHWYAVGGDVERRLAAKKRPAWPDHLDANYRRVQRLPDFGAGPSTTFLCTVIPWPGKNAGWMQRSCWQIA